ncbi:MAG: hypothetical protein ACI4DY_07880, partial [Monoglobaceae bacterium]
MRIKRFFALIVSLCLIFTVCVPTINAADSSILQTENGLNPLFKLDLEKKDSTKYGFKIVTTSDCNVKNSDGIDYLDMGRGHYVLNLDNPKEDGKYILSYDFKAETDTYEVVRFIGYDFEETVDYGNEQVFEAYSISETGLAYWPTMNATSLWKGGTLGSYNKDEWNNFTAYIDFNTKTVDYYVNNEYRLSDQIYHTFSNLYGIDLGVEGGRIKTKDLYLAEATPENVIAETNSGKAVPDSFKSPLDVSFTAKQFGHNYFSDGKVEMDISLKNKLSQNADFDITYMIKDENGMNIYEKTEERSFESGEVQNVEFSVKPSKYGVHDLYVI